ncbi:restriction endonuclease subunit S [Rhodococcus sp. NPDC003382]
MTAAAGWPRVRLGEIGQSLIGLTYSPSNVKRSGTLVLRSSNIQNGSLSFDDNVYVDSIIPEKIRVRENDILICVRNGSRRLIGKSVLLDHRAVGQTFGAFMAVYRSDANPFLQYFFQSDDFKIQIDEHLGATINQITNGSLNSFTVALPSAAEQAQIVATLGSIDNLVSTLERLLAKKQAIKQGMMQQLVTGRTRLPGFADPWTETRLGTLGKCIRGVGYDPGQDLSSSDRPHTIRLLRSNNVQRSRIDRDGLQFVHERRVAPSQVLEYGDIVICMANGSRALVGKAARFEPAVGEPRYTFGAFMGAFRTDKSIASSRFVAEILETHAFRGWLDVILSGSSINNLRPGDVEGFTTIIPGLTEQMAIADTLADADAEINLLHERLRKARDTKTGMMQQLLTGRTRLPVEAAS